MRSAIRQRILGVLNRMLGTRGLEIRHAGSHADRHDSGMALLRASGWTPGTVIDVGVATGTPWLYTPFPHAKLVLIDPNPVFADTLAELGRVNRADVYPHAVGAQDGELTLHVDTAVPSSSSLLATTEALSRARGTRAVTDVRVPVRTLDATLAGRNYPPPFLLKVDTEGFELDVLKGAVDTLRFTDAVVAETSVMARFEGSYEFADLVSFMDTHGFRLFDIIHVTTLGRGGPINYMDLAFVKRSSPLAAMSRTQR